MKEVEADDILFSVENVLKGLSEWNPTQIAVAGIRGDGALYVSSTHDALSAIELLQDAIDEIDRLAEPSV